MSQHSMEISQGLAETNVNVLNLKIVMNGNFYVENESTEIRATLFDLKKDSKSRKLILVNLRIIFET